MSTYEHDSAASGQSGRRIMAKVRIVEVRESYGSDFYVYANGRLVRVCPSMGMAREVAAGVSA
jgi:hypothetical protein